MANAGQLTYSLGLNASAFTGAMKRAIGMVLSYKAVMATIRGFSKAFDLGEELTHLSAETGEAAGNLLIMKQAFEDVGLASGEMQNALRYMRRSLTGISDMGQRTDEVFAALGVNIASLRGQDAVSQFQAIGRALGGLATQEDRVNAAMTIFGRSGSGMLRIFANPQAFEQAAAALGSMPEIMDKYSAKMEAIRTGWGRIRTSIVGAFAGALGPALPLLDKITQKINSIDFAKIGAGIAAAFGAFKDVFLSIDPKEFAVALANVVFTSLSAAVREAFGLLFKASFWKGVGLMLLGSLTGIGAAILDAFAPVGAFLSAAILRALDLLKDGMAIIPGLKKFVEGHESKSFGEHYQAELTGQRENFVKPAQEAGAELFVDGAIALGQAATEAGKTFASAIAESAGGQYFAGLGKQFDEDFTARMADALGPIEQAATGSQAAGAGTAAGAPGATHEAASDRWARVGAFAGGTIDAQALDYARQTARSTTLLERTATRILSVVGNQEPAVL
jgi:hypothetical protein